MSEQDKQDGVPVQGSRETPAPVTTTPEPAAADAQPAKRPRAEKHVTLLGAILMQAITVAVCVAGAYVLDGRQSAVTTVVTADTEAIVNAKLLEMQRQGLVEEEFSKQSTAFIQRLTSRLEEYRVSGFMVVNDNAVVVSPDTVNITSELAAYVGLNPAAVMRGKSGQAAR